MKNLLFFLCVFLGFSNAQAQKPEIVGGAPVNNGDYGFMATLLEPGAAGLTNLENQFFCGGSLITNEWVLTAAHCLLDPSTGNPISANQVEIGFNIYALENPNGTWVHRTVDTVILHPDFVSGVDENSDVALIKLSQPVNIKPVNLPLSINDTVYETVGSLLRSIGFGANNDPNVVPNFNQSDTLLFVDLTAISVDSAKSLHSDYADLNSKALPTLGPDADQDKSPCFGDSGGPLFNESGSDPVQVGVVSWGSYCGDADYAAVFARVSAQINWIKSHITNLSADELYTQELAYVGGRKLFLQEQNSWTNLRVLDPLGRKVYEENELSTITDLSFLKSGYYVLLVENDKNLNRIKYVAP